MVVDAVDPQVKANLLWGLVGGLGFLTLVQAYHLLGGEFVGLTVMIVVAVLVAAVTAASAHVLRRRLSSSTGSVAESESS